MRIYIILNLISPYKELKWTGLQDNILDLCVSNNIYAWGYFSLSYTHKCILLIVYLYLLYNQTKVSLTIFVDFLVFAHLYHENITYM